MRYQQVFSASDFLPLQNSGGGYITQIAFRMDSASPLFAGYSFPDLQVNMSTTSKTPDGLSSVFSQNVGADNTIVFQRGSLAVPGMQSGTIGYFINFQTPFFYDAAPGHNLILDVRNYQAGYVSFAGLSFFDAENTVGDSVSSVWSLSVNGTMADAVDTIGLVTQFTYTPVPEPSAILLTICGLGVLGLVSIVKRGRWNLQ
jgi:hypothetical protein